MAVFEPDELERMRDCAWMLREIVRDLEKAIAPGATTRQLDRTAATLVQTYGARASFKGYRGYPCAITASINEEVINGIPGDRALADGDLLKLQLGIENDGLYAYWAGTYPVGTVPQKAQDLLRAGRKALEAAVLEARPRKGPEDLSQTIQRVLQEAGQEPIRQYCGHGIGRQMHEEPRIPSYFDPRVAGRYQLSAGEVLAVQVLATDRKTRLTPTRGGLTVAAERGVHSIHLGAIVAVGDPPETLCGPF